MNDYRSASALIVGAVAQIEANRQLKIELNGGTLMRPLQCILDGNVYFGAIKGTITWIELPWITQFAERLRKCFLGFIPLLDFAEIFFRTSRENQIESESEQGIDTVEEIEASFNFAGDLLRGAKDVRIVLLETPDPRQSG